MSSRPDESNRAERRGESSTASEPQACAACGAAARRAAARFCSTCGRRLGEDYFPTDWLRASYRFERRPSREARQETATTTTRRAAQRAVRRRVLVASRARPSGDFMASQQNDGATTTALAFVTYALVPYLGILFCPGALLLGGVGLVRAYRSPHAGGRRAAALSIALGLLVLSAQLVLWWVLYKVPEWSRQAL